MSIRDQDTATVSALVSEASAAPSLHNTQPWAFRYLSDTGILLLYADRTRALPRTDPDSRGLHLGCGAALLNLRVAAAAAGLAPDVRLLPYPADTDLLAEVRLWDPAPPDMALALLGPAVRRRHSSRHPYLEQDIPGAWQGLLADTAEAEGAQLLFPGTWHVRSLLRLAEDAEGWEEADPDLRGETERWARVESADAREITDGIPAEAFGPRGRRAASPVRDFADGRAVPGREWATFEADPHFALLGTVRDGREDWLRAGQALERVLLVATDLGLVASLMSQPLEWPELRWVARDPLSTMANVQMIVRLGWGPEGHPSPRRPVAEFLDIV
ncbi:Acg family FMN-binding oxidoreductase [Streptomyces sp. NPDC090023]|uniref:Acg family FMN-binding oxidoreductase n=1 Tax=unclassified Streptomyces TaxID=2593676 RepID=UPI00382D9CC4